MLIEETTMRVNLDLLDRARLGRLACAQGPQPYVVPFYFAYHYNYLYSFSTVGQKIEWMRSNSLVCVEVDEVVSAHKWVSVIVFGRYEELLDTPEWRSEREVAWKVLQRYRMWWEPGYSRTIVHGTERILAPVFYRIHIDRITGRQAILEPEVPTDTRLSMTDVAEGGRLRRGAWLVLGRLRR